MHRSRILVGAVLGLSLLASAAAIWWLVHDRELPDFAASVDAVQVPLEELSLVGRWPRTLGAPWPEGWEVTSEAGAVVVRPACGAPGEPCATRYARPALSLRPVAGGTAAAGDPAAARGETESTGGSAQGPAPVQLRGPGPRTLRFVMETREAHRLCESVLVGRLTLEARAFEVSCSFTAEDGCRGRGAWCLPYLRALTAPDGA